MSSDETVFVTPISENVLSVEAPRTSRIKTVEQLSEAGNVDASIWEVERFKLNKWEVGAKDSDNNIVVEPLFQVTAWYRRRKMIELAPTLRPVLVNRKSATFKKSKYRQPGGIEKALILPDPHFGYMRDQRTGKLVPLHDMRAIDVALQIAYDIRPDYVIHLGDIMDLAEWSDKFPRTPEFQQTTQPSIIAANWWLGRLRDAVSGAVHVMLEGNHDKRLELAIVQHLKTAYGLRPADQLDLPPAMSIPRLLALHDVGVLYQDSYPNGEYFLTPDLMCVHGMVARKGGGATASAVVKDYDISVIQGHIHRIEQTHRTTFNGDGTRVIGAYSPGCLCHIDGRVPGVKKRQDWQQGIAVAYFSETMETNVQLYQIKNGKCLFGNTMYEGTDRTMELQQATGWEFA